MKVLSGYSIAVLLLLFISSCAVVSLNSSAGDPVAISPEVIFTYLPPYPPASYDTVITGVVSNSDSSKYMLSLWIFVPGWGWVPKPTYVSWVTYFQPDGTWNQNFLSGGHDWDATYLIMYLIPRTYPYNGDIYALAADSVTYAIVNRYDIASGAPPQVSVSNAVSNVLTIYHVEGYTNLTVYFRASDDYNVEGVFAQVHSYDFEFHRTAKAALITYSTNITFDFYVHVGTNYARYFAKDSGYHYSTTNDLMIVCVPFKLPEVTCDVLQSPYLFTNSAVMHGTAFAEAGVAEVFVYTNGVQVPVTGTTNWTAGITTDPDNETLLTVFCVDNYGLSSLTNSTLVHFGLAGVFKNQ